MPLLAISLVSAGVLGYEVLLMRLYSVAQWHHFAYMFISIALLGFGASGTFLAIARSWLLARFLAVWQASAVAFGVTAPLAFALAQPLAIHPLEMAWNPVQALRLSAVYLLLMVPFFCAATCIGLAFARFGARIGRIYRYDLTGAGAGALGVLGALYLLAPEDGLRLVLALGCLAAAAAGLTGPAPGRLARPAALAAGGIVLALALPGTWIAPAMSQYKGLSAALRVPGTRVVARSSSPLGLVSVVESSRTPLRHAPGLSLSAPAGPPEQLGLFVDGEGPDAITRFDGDLERLAYLDYATAALPYHLLYRPAVLILGAGGGAEVLRARYHGAGRIEAAESDPAVIRLLRGQFADFAGHIYDPDRARVFAADARGALALAGSGYDLVQVPILGRAGGGLGGLRPAYAYTVEAVTGYLGRLDPGGFAAFTGTLRLPPRESLKLFLTAVAALERLGIAEPGRRLVMIRSWDTVTLLIKKGEVTAREIAAVRRFAAARGFDLAYVPGMDRAEANRVNLLEAPYLYDGAAALLGPARARTLAAYKFDLRPAWDDRPYFFDFFTWRALPELLALARKGAMPLIEWGHLVLLATAAQALVLGAALILLPLWVWRRRGVAQKGRGRIMAYFLALGLAFLFIEIAFIQRLALFLGDPVVAAAVALAAFLAFAGAGAGMSPRLAARLPARLPGEGRITAVEAAVAAIAALALLYVLILPVVTDWLVTLPLALKGALALVFIAPLAFVMGLPFPLGLARVSETAPALVPWAWGINGCASVLSAVLATLLAVTFGFSAVVALAVALYILAAAVWRGSEDAS